MAPKFLVTRSALKHFKIKFGIGHIKICGMHEIFVFCSANLKYKNYLDLDMHTILFSE